MAGRRAVFALSFVLLVPTIGACFHPRGECISFNWDAAPAEQVSFKTAHALGTPGNFLPRLGTPTAIFLAHDPPRGRMVVFRYDLSSNRRILLYEQRASMTPAQFHTDVKASGHGIRVRDDREAIAFSGPSCDRSTTQTSVEWLEGRILFLFRARNLGLDQAHHLIQEI